MANATKKATLATVKAFIRKNSDKLFIATKGRFDGMTDCVQRCADTAFSKVTIQADLHSNELGIKGAWFVFGSRDYITPFEKDGFVGFHISNCCGSFELAVKL